MKRFLPGIAALLALTLASPATAASSSISPKPTAPTTAINSNDPTGVIVGFKDVRSASTVSSLTAHHPLTNRKRLPNANAQLFSVTNGESAHAVAERISRLPGIAFAEPNYNVRSTATTDPRINNLWGLRNTGQNISGHVGISGIDSKASEAWPTSTGNGVIVAVIDTGTDINHSDIAPRLWRNSDDCFNDGIDHDGNGFANDCHGWDFLHDDNTPYDAIDGDEHGTHVSATIAAEANNGTGGAGVAPGALIMPLKFIGSNGGSISDAIDAIAYAKNNGAKVINASWAGPGYSTALRNAIADSGSVFVAAAGNEGNDLNAVPTYPAAYDLPNILTVAAIDNRGGLASFSNYNGTTDIGAPGVDIYSALPKREADIAAVAHTPTSGTYRSSFWGFGLEAVVGANVRRDLLRAELVRLGASDLTSPISVVDDDESSSGISTVPDTASYYTAALTAAGYTNFNVIPVNRGESGPAEGTIHGRTVIWQTGYAMGANGITTLTSTDQSQLSVFLQGGGKLLVAGPDAIWNSDATTFVRDYLGVNYVSEGDPRNVLTGTGTLAGITLNISGAESPKGYKNPYEDRVTIRTGSAASMNYSADPSYDNSYGYMSGTSMAAPHVAGVAALVQAVYPSGSPAAIVGVLASTVRPLDSLKTTTTAGGLVDAKAAVAKGIALNSPTPPSTGTPPPPSPPPTSSEGYRFVASDGGIFSFGSAGFYGSLGSLRLNQPIIGMASTPTKKGYWLVGADGGIFTFGDAKFHGSAGNVNPSRPIVAMAATADGGGYWLVSSAGDIYAFGNAGNFGSVGHLQLNRPIVTMAPTSNGQGYWLVATDGGVFSFGNAQFLGSTGSIKLNQNIVSMAATPDASGYWMVAADGGIFAFGSAGFMGSAGGLQLNKPVVSMSVTDSGKGYWMVATDGGIFSYGDAKFFGSTGSLKLNQPIVAITD